MFVKFSDNFVIAINSIVAVQRYGARHYNLVYSCGSKVFKKIITGADYTLLLESLKGAKKLAYADGYN